jgi:putative oxidoreductase
MLSKLWNCMCADKYAHEAALLLRFVLGVIFLWHGYDKVFVKGLPAITGFLGSLGFPLPSVFAIILSYGELVFGAMLIVGLLTHLAAKYAAIIAVVAFFTVHMKNGFAVSSGGYEFIILIFAVSVSVLVNGAGKYSIDAMYLGKGGNLCNDCDHKHEGTCGCGCDKK